MSPEDILLNSAEAAAQTVRTDAFAKLTNRAISLTAAAVIRHLRSDDTPGLFAVVDVERDGKDHLGSVLTLSDRLVIAWTVGTVRTEDFQVVIPYSDVRATERAVRPGGSFSKDREVLVVETEETWRIVFPNYFEGGASLVPFLMGMIDGAIRPVFEHDGEAQPPGKTDNPLPIVRDDPGTAHRGPADPGPMDRLCQACGAALRAEVRFCTGCGAARSDPGVETPAQQSPPLDPPTPEPAPTCSSCERPLAEGVAFCTGCGTPVGEQENKPAVPVSPAPPPPVQVPAPPAVVTAAGRPSRRRTVVVAGIAAAVLLGGTLAAVALTRDGDPPAEQTAAQDAGSPTPEPVVEPSEASGEIDDAGGVEAPEEPVAVTRQRIDLMPAFIDPDPADPGDVCFGPGPRPVGTAWMEIGGVRYYEDVVQCGSRSRAADAAGVLRFDADVLGLRPGDRIVAVGGDFAFDESAVSQGGSRVRWTVVYGDHGICYAGASFGETGSCERSFRTGVVETTGGVLELRQQIVRVTAPDRGLWAGVHRPSIVVERSGAAAPVVGDAPADEVVEEDVSSAPPTEDELVWIRGELDRLFLEIKAGDFSSGDSADALVERLRYSGDALLGNAAYNAGMIRYANGDCTGAQEAFGLAATVAGTAEQAALRNRAAAAADAGCELGVQELLTR